ncbi:Cupin [Candidatus Hydrogenisulfobacillus filiaventi]|uniref:Cupin n=1 Tax=Candidatus Hydrogenisulfobacillus filiaventi TaxID=2707344 RepID=A0A6F8ZF54_9FIRM|nr:cupin domain-containing protein [Bacillota bacterium]CAB1128092.1 Cupin [Candidatus Hydrogenisulfobacillus filiaventi]
MGKPEAGGITRVDKPWGYEVWWAVTGRYAGKILHVEAGQSLSLQYHRVKEESMYCLAGEGILELDGRRRPFRAGQAVHIPPGTRHRLQAVTALEVVEVSSPELEDVVRLADRYGRADSPASLSEPQS